MGFLSRLSEKQNIRTARRLQKLKTRRISAEGKAELRKLEMRERKRIEKARSTGRGSSKTGKVLRTLGEGLANASTNVGQDNPFAFGGFEQPKRRAPARRAVRKKIKSKPRRLPKQEIDFGFF